MRACVRVCMYIVAYVDANWGAVRFLGTLMVVQLAISTVSTSEYLNRNISGDFIRSRSQKKLVILGTL